MPARQILVLEDEPNIRDLWVEALESAGYGVLGLTAGDEALARLANFTPDLILLDMMMPGMDGFEFLARLRQNPVCAQVPVLIISALGDALVRAIDQQAARTLGVVGVLTKPVAVESLIGHVRRIIGPAGA